MKTKLILFLTTAFVTFGQPASNQTLERTFNFSHTVNAQDMQEIANAVRATGDIRQAAVDTGQKLLTVHGTADQLALTEWLLSYLDIADTPADVPALAIRKYQLAASKNRESVISVFYLPHTETGQNFQEAATVVRSIGELRWLFVCSGRKAMVVRGTDEQIDFAGWMINELDQPAIAASSSKHEYLMPGLGFPDNVVRLFALKNAATPQRLQEIALQVRTSTQIRRLFTYTAPKLIALRGTPGQVEEANQMISELDR